MTTPVSAFDEHAILHELKHFLPAQAPLKDFIHHNTLHAFQYLKFFKGIRKASDMFGYKVSLTLEEYRRLYRDEKISPAILEKIITDKKGKSQTTIWLEKALSQPYENGILPKIGAIRANWKRHYQIDMDVLVHPILFRVLCSYLDQGISIWGFPVRQKTFLSSLREMERNSFTSFFKISVLNNFCCTIPAK